MSVASNNNTNQQNNKRLSWSVTFTPKRICSFLTVQVLLCGVCVLLANEYIFSPQATIANITGKKQQISQRHQEVVQLKQQTELQLGMLAQRMGLLTARMNRIDALGERLAQNADFEEFNFSQLPALGGPSELSALSASSELSGMLSQIDNVLGHLDAQQNQLSALEHMMLNHDLDDDSTIEGRPIKRGWMSSLYGMRNDPFNGRLTMHKGVDFAGTDGEPILATGAGVVSWSGERYGYGLLVEVDHGGGLKTRYAHARELLVSVGTVVTKGQKLALMGNTGRSTGAHVHYEVLSKERQVNPRKYIYR